MPSSLDSVRPIGVEAGASEGGTQVYTTPTEIDVRSDALAAAGLHVVGSTASSSNDKTVYVDRTSGGLRLTDANTQRLLSELVTSVRGGVSAHSALLDIQHFLSGEGPGDGWASGAYLTINYSGILPTSWIWWASNAQQAKIVSRTLTYLSTAPLVQSETWQLFNSAGQAVRTLVDTHSYNTVMRTSTTRTWS